eukprot:gene8585-11006_t
MGVEEGGTEVALLYESGNSSFQRLITSCRFGNLPAVRAAIKYSIDLDTTVTICMSPPSIPMSVTVSISCNDQDFIDTGHEFKYVSSPTVTSVNPSLVTAYTQYVRVFGGSLEYVQLCRIGPYTTIAFNVTNTGLFCPLPAVWNRAELESQLKLSLSVNHQDFTSTMHSIRKRRTPTVVTMNPALVHPGTVLLLKGEHLAHSGPGSVICLVEGARVIADVLSRDVAACRIPAIETHPSLSINWGFKSISGIEDSEDT